MEGSRARRPAAGAALCAAVFLAGCSAPRSPNVLLFVMDTTRVDAVSAYGHVAGTTPVADAGAHPEPPAAVLDRLRALGYVGDGSDAPAR